VQSVFSAVGVAPPPLVRPDYTLQQFITELVEPTERLHAVEEHKKGARYKVGSCMAEMTEVVAEGKRTRTVAIESEDPAQVIAAVRELGLDRFDNVSYPRGLKRLLGIKS